MGVAYKKWICSGFQEHHHARQLNEAGLFSNELASPRHSIPSPYHVSLKGYVIAVL